MRDNETQAAIVQKWNATDALTAIVPGGLHEAPVNIEGNARPALPYATMEVGPDGRANELSFGGGEIDYRRVKLTAYAKSQDTTAAIMVTIEQTFREKPLTITSTNPSETAEWMRTEGQPGNRGRLEKADKANADSIWKGTMEYVVWSSREAV